MENRKKSGALSIRPTLEGESLDELFRSLGTSINKIRKRGGEVIFIRPPSSGEDWKIENIVNPRPAYYDALLTSTKTQGIHFLDYSETADLICVDGSHLSPQDAVIYTRHLIKILREEKGWIFTRNSSQPVF